MKLRLLSTVLLIIMVAQVNTTNCWGISVNNNSTKFKVSGAVVEMTSASNCQNMYMQEPPNGPSPLMPGQSWSDSKSGVCTGICLKSRVLLRIGTKDSTGQLAYWYNIIGEDDFLNIGATCSSINVNVTDSQVVISSGTGTFGFTLDASGRPVSGSVTSAN